MSGERHKPQFTIPRLIQACKCSGTAKGSHPQISRDLYIVKPKPRETRLQGGQERSSSNTCRARTRNGAENAKTEQKKAKQGRACGETQRTPRESSGGAERGPAGIHRGRSSAGDAGAPREPLAPPEPRGSPGASAGTSPAQRPRPGTAQPGSSPPGAAQPGSPRPARTCQRRRRPQRRCPFPAHRARACSPLPPGPQQPRPPLLGTCSPVRRSPRAPPRRSDYNSQQPPRTVALCYNRCRYWFGPASRSDQSHGGSRRLGPRCAARRHWRGGERRPISAGRGGALVTPTAGDWPCPQQPDQ